MTARWTPRIDGALIASFAAMLWAACGDRGLNLWALSNLRFVLGVNSWVNSSEGATLDAAFNGAVRYFPGPALLASYLFGSSAMETGLRLLGIAAGALVVWGTWSSAHSIAGRAPAAVVGVVLALHPWMASAVTVASPTVFVVAGLALSTSLLLRKGERGPVWSAALAVVLAWSLLASSEGWLWLVAVFAMLFIDFGSDQTTHGRVRIRTVALWELAVIPAAVLLAIALNPWWLEDPAHHVGQGLRHWLRAAPEPWLFFGERFGQERMSWWVPPLGSLLWLPAVLVVPTLTGLLAATWGAVTRARPSHWLVLIPVVGSWTLLWSMRTAWHGGVDLRLWVLITALLCSALGLRVLLNLDRSASPLGASRRNRGLLLAGVVTFVLADALPSLSSPESWHSTLIGRTAGAAASGMWRNPHAPIAPEFAEQLSSQFGGLRWVVVVNDWEWHPVLDYYAETGRISPVVWSSLANADIAIVVYEDAAPELYSNWPDIAALRVAGRSVASQRAPDGTLLVEVFDLRAGGAP
jgi:hypothetical protein